MRGVHDRLAAGTWVIPNRGGSFPSGSRDNLGAIPKRCRVGILGLLLHDVAGVHGPRSVSWAVHPPGVELETEL